MKYVVVDLEATCWRAEKPEDAERVSDFQRTHSEVIEIGAVKLEGNLSTINEFQSFVKPEIVPTLSEFCTKLTTITQADVDAAPSFAVAFTDFVSGLGNTGEVTLCSWGQYDWTMLQKECARHGIEFPKFAGHVNVKEAYLRKHGGKKGASPVKALAKLGLEFTGTHHRGIDDARNIVTVFRALSVEGGSR